MGREIKRIARFLEVDIDAVKWPAILEHCSFDYMRSSSMKIEELDMFFKGGGRREDWPARLAEPRRSPRPRVGARC